MLSSSSPLCSGGQSPPSPRCSKARLKTRLFTPEPDRVSADLWVWRRPGRQTDRRKADEKTVWMNRPSSLVSAPSCQSARWAAALRCVHPPVITLYDLLHSKCYINLVTPLDYIPLLAPHTHTHNPYHANIVILARNFLPLLAVTSDLMVL